MRAADHFTASSRSAYLRRLDDRIKSYKINVALGLANACLGLICFALGWLMADPELFFAPYLYWMMFGVTAVCWFRSGLHFERGFAALKVK